MLDLQSFTKISLWQFEFLFELSVAFILSLLFSLCFCFKIKERTALMEWCRKFHLAKILFPQWTERSLYFFHPICNLMPLWVKLKKKCWRWPLLFVFQVLYYTTANLESLTLSTRVFRNAMFDSTLPWQMIDSAAGRLSVVRWVIIESLWIAIKIWRVIAVLTTAVWNWKRSPTTALDY